MIDTQRFNARCAQLLKNGYVLRSKDHGTYSFVHFWHPDHYDAIGQTDLLYMSSNEWVQLISHRPWLVFDK